MLEKISLIYRKFPDCFVEKINYNSYISEEEKENVEVFLSCFNFENEGKKEKIKLIFKNIALIKFINTNNFPSLFLDEVYTNEEKGIITFDFFPIDHFDYLQENSNSEFIIKCREISYEVIE